jgi:cell division protease FtsH
MQDLDEARDKISFGRERRKLMDEEDRKITAYHEAGHALVQAVVDDGQMPVHKVTIIPRGQSLGSTMFMPKKDILNHSKRRLMNQICCAMGGRCAEEIVMGDITSGASGDIRMATKTARHMVCDWGMTDLGPVAYGENKDHIFLGQEIERSQNYSEATAQRIDKMIHDIVEEQYQRSLEILKEHRSALDVCADALLEHETIDGKHVQEILEFGEMRSPVVKREIAPAEPEPKGSEEETDEVEAEEKEDGGLAGEGTPAGAPA